MKQLQQQIRSRCSGFTLLELIIVIAILAVLIGILVPVGAKARKLSENATCQTRIRGIAVAMMAYYTDYNEFPSSQHWVGKGNVTTPDHRGRNALALYRLRDDLHVSDLQADVHPRSRVRQCARSH